MMGHSMFFRFIRVFAAAAGMAFTIAVHMPAAQAAQSAALQKLVEGAKKETTLRAMWSASSLGGGSGFIKIVNGMNKRYGTEVKPQFTPGADMQRMMATTIREITAGQQGSSDVYWGNAEAILQAMTAKGQVLVPMDWRSLLERSLPSAPGFDPIAPGNIALASSSTLVGVTYNSDLVKGDDIPRRLEDVLKPKWKGKIASTPYAAGLREFAMPDLLGRERILAYTKRLAQQIGGLTRCGENDRLTSGEFVMLAFSCGDEYANLAQKTGTPLGYAVMEEAVVSHTRYAAVPANTKAPNAAALFMIYLHTEEGQQLMWEVGGFDFHLYPESNERKIIDKVRASGAKFVVNSPQWLNSLKGFPEMQAELEKILRQGR